jgi:hypothetical protein
LEKKVLLPEVIKSRIQNELPKNFIMILPAVIKNIRKKNRREPYLGSFLVISLLLAASVRRAAEPMAFIVIRYFLFAHRTHSFLYSNIVIVNQEINQIRMNWKKVFLSHWKR